MKYLSKRRKDFSKWVDQKKAYSLEEAVAGIAHFPKTKFDETVEMHFHLGIDTEATDQSIRGTVILPHGTGKKIRMAVFCKGENIVKAKGLGVEHVGSEDLIEKVEKGFLDFDCIIATPDMMRELSKLGRILGPRGLMPSPKAGTVTMDIAKAIQDVRSGKIEFKSDKQGGVHVGIGKRSFSTEKLVENARHLLEAVNHTRPSSMKGNFIKGLSISTTMGPGIRVSLS
jgi:large subunit ribosomal protein L1